MCAIIGFESDNVKEQDLSILKRVLIESKIRGKHASGIAWCNGDKIICEKKPIPIDKFFQNFDLKNIVFDGKIRMIAHARYSTSDLKYNQPLVSENGEIAIAHNGVVTQEGFEKWEELFGYKCITKNDSELLLKALENNKNVFEIFPGASIALVILTKNGLLSGCRNGKRPLWCGKIGEGKIYASTFDILKRSNVECIEKVLQYGEDLQLRYFNESKSL